MQLLAVGLIVGTLSCVTGWRILVVAPHGTKSHQNVYSPLIKALAARGHYITVITNYGLADDRHADRIRQIVLNGLAIDVSQLPDYFRVSRSPYGWLSGLITIANGMIKMPSIIAETMYDNLQVRDLIAHDRFDLVMVSQACTLTGYPLAWHFNAQLIVLSPNTLFPGLATVLGDQDHYSYVPFVLSAYSDRMNLYQRVINTVTTKFFDYLMNQWHRPTVLAIVRQKAMPDCPPLHEIERSVALVFTNSHPTSTYPRTLPPQVIEVGGVHCRAAEPLPADLELFVSSSAGATSGFIVFAVGSALRMEDMPISIRKTFIDVFSRLPQRVVWQWKGPIPADLPTNIMPVSWLPQQDLLGYERCRAFLTHGGLNSLQEAIYHGVPVLGLPFGTDQHLNVNKAVRDGYALNLDWSHVTNDTLTHAIDQLVHNSSYSTVARRLSNLFRDQPQTPLERAVYWTEFVLRHNGTGHLRLGSRHLTPFERNLVDVYLAVFLTMAAPLILLCLCLRNCCQRCNSIVGSKIDKVDKKRQ